MRPPKLLLALVVSLVALLAMGLLVVSADEGDDVPETFITRLEPGDNVVGWTTQAAPVETLFESVPQIQHVWTWDASRLTMALCIATRPEADVDVIPCCLRAWASTCA